MSYLKEPREGEGPKQGGKQARSTRAGTTTTSRAAKAGAGEKHHRRATKGGPRRGTEDDSRREEGDGGGGQQLRATAEGDDTGRRRRREKGDGLSASRAAPRPTNSHRTCKSRDRQQHNSEKNQKNTKPYVF